MKIERIFGVLIAAALGTALFTSCQDEKETYCRFEVGIEKNTTTGTEEEISAFMQYFSEIETALQTACGIPNPAVDIKGDYKELSAQKKAQFENAVVPEFTAETTGTYSVTFILTGYEITKDIDVETLSTRTFSNEK